MESPNDTFQSGKTLIDQHYVVSDKNIPAMSHFKLIEVDATTNNIMGGNSDNPYGSGIPFNRRVQLLLCMQCCI